MLTKNALQTNVIDTGLCTGCGMCYAVCPVSAIEISAYTDQGEPVIDGEKCTQCNHCLQCCPGVENFWGLSVNSSKQVYTRNDCYTVGTVKDSYLSYSMNPQERAKSASGGTVSALCRFLLDSKIVDTVIGVGFTKPLEPAPFIIHDSEDVASIRQSKYVRVPNCKALKDERLGNSICFVGLPCHLKAIKKASKVHPEITRGITLLIGLYCGNGLYFEATTDLIKKMGCSHSDEIQSIQYREGKWPGNFTLKKHNGEIIAITKMTFNYLSFFYTPKRCYLCNELPSFDADISFADGWVKEEDDSKGWNSTIVRTDIGEQVIRDAVKTGYIYTEQILVEQAVAMHRHGIYNKHYLANLRCKIFSLMNIKTPNYVQFKINTRDYIKASLTLLLFSVGGLRIIKFISQLVPFKVYEILMVFSRKTWKKIA